MHTQIRRMRRQDLADALDVLAEVAEESLWLGVEPGFDREGREALWAADLDDPNAAAFVIVDPVSGAVVGHGRVVKASYGVADVGMVLARAARGQGNGGRLLDVLVASADSLGAHKVQLQVWPHNEAAIRLYLSRGFVVEGRQRRHYPRANGELWDSVSMGLLLAGPGATMPGSALPDATSLGAPPRPAG